MPKLYLIHGLPGTGKTTFATALARETGAVLLNHDALRIAIFGQNPPNETFSQYTEGISVYLWSLSAEFLSRGISVILDHGFWTRSSRDEARRRGAAMGCEVVFHSMVCPSSIADARVQARNEAGTCYVIPLGALAVFRQRFEAMGADEPHSCVKTH